MPLILYNGTLFLSPVAPGCKYVTSDKKTNRFLISQSIITALLKFKL